MTSTVVTDFVELYGCSLPSSYRDFEAMAPRRVLTGKATSGVLAIAMNSGNVEEVSPVDLVPLPFPSQADIALVRVSFPSDLGPDSALEGYPVLAWPSSTHSSTPLAYSLPLEPVLMRRRYAIVEA